MVGPETAIPVRRKGTSHRGRKRSADAEYGKDPPLRGPGEKKKTSHTKREEKRKF